MKNDVVINVVEQKVVVEVRTHPVDRRRRKWNYTDLVNGRINWGVARNARYGDVVPTDD